jgi:tetratricopeptide (TPR) repeat protein
MRKTPSVRIQAASALLLVCALGAPAPVRTAPAGEKVPITTGSEDARRLYLQGRDLAEKLRATDARRYFEQATEKDPGFVMAWVGLATSSGTSREFVDAVTHAVAAAPNASEGERHIALGLEAGLKGEPAEVLRHYQALVAAYPSDERAQTLLGNTYFGRQEYDKAIAHYRKATAIDPAFTQPYNQLGYALRFLEQYDEAEAAFKQYAALIPDDPNPYDSYGELLMKMGRFDDSIAMYEKALAIDRNFVASYVGIGNDQMFAGRSEAARATFAKIAAVARNTGEQRLAHFWIAAAYVHDGATDKALAEIEASAALSGSEHDAATQSGDMTQMGDILREAGRTDEALAKYTRAVELSDAADLPAEAKAATRRNHLFEQGRVAAARHDVAGAKAMAAEYAAAVTPRQVPFEIRQMHELEGLIALEAKDYEGAAEHFAQANQQDPRVVYLTAVALKGSGNAVKASAMAARAASFNGLSFSYAYERRAAIKMAGDH